MKKRNLSESHKQKISVSMRGLKSSEEKKRKISESLSNGNHFRALLWTIQSPTGEIFITKNIKGLCVKFNLVYSTLRLRHQQKDKSPIWTGKSKGWAVISAEKTGESGLEPFEIID